MSARIHWGALSNANAKTQAIGKFIQLLAIQLNHSLALLCAPNLNTRAVLCCAVCAESCARPVSFAV